MSDGTQLLPGFDEAPGIVREVPVRAHRRRVSGPPKPALVRSTDPSTSGAAAKRQGNGTPRAIIAAFAQYGAMTDEGLVQVLPGRVEGTVKTCRSRLSAVGYLEAIGTAKNSHGCDMQVHQLTDAGRYRARTEAT